MVGKPFSTEKYGVGLKKGDTELCGKVNAALEKMVSDGLAEGGRRQRRPVGVQGRHRDQPAEAGGLLVVAVERGVRPAPAPTSTQVREVAGWASCWPSTTYSARSG